MSRSTYTCPECDEPLILSSERISPADFEDVMNEHDSKCKESYKTPAAPAR